MIENRSCRVSEKEKESVWRNADYGEEELRFGALSAPFGSLFFHATLSTDRVFPIVVYRMLGIGTSLDSPVAFLNVNTLHLQSR